MIFPLAQFALKLLSRKTYDKFEESLAYPDKAQAEVLSKMFSELKDSQYLNSLGLDSLQNTYDWENLPIVTYENLQSPIEAQAQQKKSYFGQGLVKNFELTSGSSGQSKLIPYNNAVKKAFSGMFQLWLADMFKNGPKFITGKSFISVSPISKKSLVEKPQYKTDSDHLSAVFKILVQPFLVSPDLVSKLDDLELSKRILAAKLISSPDLEVISIWSPSYLTTLLDWIKANTELLISDCQRGIISTPSGSVKLASISIERRNLLTSGEYLWPKLWPKLKLISCWGSAHSKAKFEELKFIFPKVFVQPKGLLATEGPMTIPWLRANSNFLPLINHVYYEFEDKGEIYRIHELKKGRSYSLIFSVPGGFPRYKIGDQVRVTDFYKKTPCLEFIGRQSEVSDLVGEKLNATFVDSILLQSKMKGYVVGFSENMEKPRYLFFSEAKGIDSETIDAKFRQNPHYEFARKFGQLENIKAVFVPDLEKNFLDFRLHQGMKWGDIKPTSLITQDAFVKFFSELARE